VGEEDVFQIQIVVEVVDAAAVGVAEVTGNNHIPQRQIAAVVVYAFAHLFTYIFFELQLDMALVASEIVSRPYISVGMIALILLVALTATSFKRLQRKMGRKWQTLHNSIYLVLPLALLHFSWSQKTFWQEPVWYWLVGLLLMSPRIKRWYSTYQRKQQGRKSTAKKGRGKENIA